jgi:hypothetical protein
VEIVEYVPPPKKEPYLTEEQKNPPAECPNCKSGRVLPIVYGYPNPEDFDWISRKKKRLTKPAATKSEAIRRAKAKLKASKLSKRKKSANNFHDIEAE